MILPHRKRSCRILPWCKAGSAPPNSFLRETCPSCSERPRRVGSPVNPVCSSPFSLCSHITWSYWVQRTCLDNYCRATSAFCIHVLAWPVVTCLCADVTVCSQRNQSSGCLCGADNFGLSWLMLLRDPGSFMMLGVFL